MLRLQRSLSAPVVAFFILGLPGPDAALAQLRCSDVGGTRTCIIEPVAAPGHIENTIAGDTTSTGGRVDPNTTYVLRRGGTYPYTQQLRNDWPLKVVAEEGDGPRPVILPFATPGAETPRLFRSTGGDIHLIGLRFLGFDNFGVYTDNANVRLAADGVTAIIEDCIIENQRLDFFRSDNPGTVMKLINSVIWNNFQENAIWKGWGIRPNNQPQDTIMVVNNVFVNSAAHTNWGFWGNNHNYVEWSHNTFLNVGMTLDDGMKNSDDEFAVVQLAQADVGIAENNLFYNVAYMGDNASPGRVFIIQHDSLRDENDDPYLPTSITIRNNYVYLDPAIETAWGDSISAVPFLEPWLRELAAAKHPSYQIEDAIVEDVSPFTNAPSDVTALIDQIQDWYTTDDPGITIRLDDEPGSESLDLTYDRASSAFSGSTHGLPAGALFQWGISVPIASDGPPELQIHPGAFRLNGNYPNPFNPTTVIAFQLTAPADVSIRVFDITGRLVLQVPPVTFAAGMSHEMVVEATRLGSGTYMYQVRADMGGAVITKTGRMTLVK